jgi:hypothetical protein
VWIIGEQSTREGWLEKVFREGQDPQMVVMPIIIIIIILIMMIIIIMMMIIIIIAMSLKENLGLS